MLFKIDKTKRKKNYLNKLPWLNRLISNAFKPSFISDCELWLDASDANTIILNGTDVSVWSDKSGNSKDLSQAVEVNQPAYTQTMNGKNVITFNGTTDILEGALDISELTNAEYTLFVVCKPTAFTTSSWGLAGFGSFKAGMQIDSGMRPIISQDIGGVERYARNSQDVLYTDVDYIFSGRVSSALGTVNLQKNGREIDTTAFTPGGAFTTGGTFRVGRRDASSWFNGDIAEVILYSRYLTDAELLSVNRYLQNKWGVFTPTQIEDCELWLDSSDKGAVTLNGSDVSAIEDKSGEGNDATQATALKQPAYTGTLNGLSVLSFDGSNDNLNLDSIAALFPIDQLTVITVSVSSDGDGRVISFRGNADTNRLPLIHDVHKVSWKYSNGTIPSNISTDAEDGNPHVVISSAKGTGSIVDLYVDEVFKGSNSQTDTLETTDACTLGSDAASGHYMLGDIAEIIVYSRALSVSERSKIESYLMDKWGI